MRRKVQAPIELPDVGAAFETGTLEFKKTSAGATHFELAKDVAALANNRGGTIIVGAVEHGGVLRSSRRSMSRTRQSNTAVTSKRSSVGARRSHSSRTSASKTAPRRYWR